MVTSKTRPFESIPSLRLRSIEWTPSALMLAARAAFRERYSLAASFTLILAVYFIPLYRPGSIYSLWYRSPPFLFNDCRGGVLEVPHSNTKYGGDHPVKISHHLVSKNQNYKCGNIYEFMNKPRNEGGDPIRKVYKEWTPCRYCRCARTPENLHILSTGSRGYGYR